MNRRFEALAAKMSHCRRCGLGPGNRAVFGRFDGQRWMLVGQAPGIHEIELGRPFTASAGRRLFEWLARAGFQQEGFRSFCYMTAVMKCFPGKGERGDIRPSSRQLDNCAEFLEEELVLVQPVVLIPVGGLAIARLLGKVRLADVVGHRFKHKIGGRETTIVPLPHPSGASAWANSSTNQRLIGRAIGLLRSARS